MLLNGDPSAISLLAPRKARVLRRERTAQKETMMFFPLYAVIFFIREFCFHVLVFLLLPQHRFLAPVDWENAPRQIAAARSRKTRK